MVQLSVSPDEYTAVLAALYVAGHLVDDDISEELRQLFLSLRAQGDEQYAALVVVQSV